MRKIKVLHIIKSLGRGGAEMLLPETLKIHNKNKFEFFYIYFLPWKNQMVEALEKTGGNVHCVSASNNFSLLKKYNEVIDFCNAKEIDVIHSHLPWSGFLGRIVHAKIQVPVIYTEHNIQEGYHFLTRWLNKKSFNSQNLALGVSEDVTKSIIKNIHPSIPVHTLLNGVNTDFFQKDVRKGNAIREKLNLSEDAVVIGNVAVFREQKNLRGWLHAFKMVSEQHPEVRGLLVGAGPKEEEIKELVKELNLEEKVKLPGLQTDTVSYFSAMDIFMMSSSFEGLPIALLEAMSMNCGIVSTRAGGVVEVVRNEIDGLTCEVGDEAGLASLVIKLVSDPEKRKEYQLAARQRVKASFSLAAMVKSLEEIYTDLSQK